MDEQTSGDPAFPTSPHQMPAGDLEPGGLFAGRYKLREKLGQGGMGIVFVADQLEPVKRRVALKVIRGDRDSGNVLARFEQERQALALMDHPNIAKVLDAGVSAGRPYFVMELVKGLPLTQYCDEAKLTPRQRLELFIPVCQAVQHAHQKGVIHRDLKPSNILVGLYDGHPVPKVIDFGVAKATAARLTDQSLYTEVGTLVGTLEYMSPEQAHLNNLDIDTRSDVYSLGVILYELLTGEVPFRRGDASPAGTLEMLRLLKESDPPKPSTRLSGTLPNVAARRGSEPKALASLMRGELDWVVMKALEKERDRRYDTANALAVDLQHYLAGEPVQAVPPSAGYQLRKFVSRNRGAVLAMAAVMLAVLTGAAAALWQAYRAMDAEGKALQARGEAEKSAERAAEAAAEAARLAEQRRVALYPTRIRNAWQSYEEGDLVRLRELLAGLQPGPGESDLRGFEWHYLWRLAHHRRRTLTHPHPVRGMAVSPDGKTVATCSPKSSEVWLRDAASATVRRKLDAGSPAWAVAFAPDGQEVAVSTDAGTVRVWDAASGEPRHTLRGPGKALGSLAYSADGRRLAAAVGAWTIKTGNPIDRFLPPGYSKTAGEVVVWDRRSGDELARLPGHPQASLCLALSPDGEAVAVGGVGGRLQCWEVRTKKKRWEKAAHREAVFAVAFAPDGRSLATGGWDGTIRLWESDSGRAGRTIAASHSAVLGVAFTPAGDELLSGGFDRLARRWNLATGQETGRALGHTWAVTAVGYGSGGEVWTAGWDRAVHLWPAGLSPGVEAIANSGFTLSFSPDGSRLAATGGGKVDIYDTDTRRPVRALAVPGDSDLAVAYSPDGRLLVAAGMKGVVHRWRADEYTPLPPLTGHRVKVWGLAFSPDGKTLASAAGLWNVPGEVRLWDPHAGRLLREHDPKSKTVRTIAFTPDGASLLFGVGAHIGRLDVPTWATESPLPGMYHVAVTADGRTAALGQASQESFDQSLFTLMDLRTQRVRARVRGHTAEVFQVTFTPDSRTLATASWDGTVKLWHVATGEEMLTFRRSVGVIWSVAFSPDGRRMAIGGGRGRGEVSFWDARPPEQP